MTFPTIAATATSTFPAGGTSQAHNLPSGIAAGDVLVLDLAYASGGGPVTTPSGWTLLANNTTGSHQQYLYWRVANGAEGSTVTLALSSGGRTASIAYRLTGAGSVEVGSVSSANNAAPNCVSLSPSWGAADTLWIATYSMVSLPANVTSNPSNYTDLVQIVTTSGPTVAAATRQVNASSEDPGAFAVDGGHAWLAWTLAVQPQTAHPRSSSVVI